MAIKTPSLAISYIIKIVVGLENIIRSAKSVFTDERGFRKLIRIPGAK